MKHTHHLIPTYKGGTNESSNLVEVSPTCHAMFHWCNWQLWGDVRDKVAWKGLAELSQKEEIVKELTAHFQPLNSVKGLEAIARLRATNSEYREREKEFAKKLQPVGTNAALSEQSKAKRKETFAKIKHAQGERNSQFGTRWITDGETERKTLKSEPLPEGYSYGRKGKCPSG